MGPLPDMAIDSACIQVQLFAHFNLSVLGEMDQALFLDDWFDVTGALSRRSLRVGGPAGLETSGSHSYLGSSVIYLLTPIQAT